MLYKCNVILVIIVIIIDFLIIIDTPTSLDQQVYMKMWKYINLFIILCKSKFYFKMVREH